MKKLLRGLAGLAGFLLFWEVVVQVGLVDRTFTPPPSVVLGTVGDLLGDPEFIRDIVATVLAWLN